MSITRSTTTRRSCGSSSGGSWALPPRGPGVAGDKWFLAERDRHANNLGESLVRESRDAEVGFDLEVEIDPPGTAVRPTPRPRRTANCRPTPFEVALHRGYYERVDSRSEDARG